ncbi:MaoC/PaaZ C-terminal domain-containing protein [Sphingobium sp. EM0848]|uniref:MaoC/PaaZ C-terminal domain-containing protein n=1 Tax=Sphingobium sp. EM0848 TaxID=2743473 RepID=UPI00159C8E50|nr:MaoC/PaaZ C-terminal domain-containing protein [Sphingobium sp. EM0848]
MNLEALIKRDFPALNASYTAKDTMLYALGVGAGADPMNLRQLPFVYEKSLKAIPAQASVIAFPGPWLTDPVLGVNYLKVLHGEQGIIFERPLKPEAEVIGEYEVLAVDDKGPEKGATVFFEKRIRDRGDGGLICRVRSTYFLRGNGGCGSWGEPPAPAQAVPDRTPDKVVDVPTIPQLALIYRLSSDYNPVHADPEVARNAGFERPILHGLSTFGIACLAAVQELCGDDPSRLKEIFTRFSRPVFPGDTVRIEMFEDGDVWRFRARVPERDVVVLDRGLFRIN